MARAVATLLFAGGGPLANRKYRRSGHNAKGRSKREGQYVNLPYAMLHSTAWRSLNGSSIKVFLELRSRFNGFNNGELHLSLDEGARLLGMSKTTVGRAFAELEQKGFIIKRKQGLWFGRQATEWQVTDQSYKGQVATRGWQKWRPEADVVEKQKSGTATAHSSP